MGKNILIIGGGIVGLSCAYYLHKEGNQVTVIDKSAMDGGASYVNAGYLTPSHIIPLASPGMMAKGLKWMFNSSSPFYMKPRLDPDFIKWAWAFNTSSTKANVEKAIPLIKDINLLSKDLYDAMHNSGELGDFQLVKKGILMLYKTHKEGNHEKEVARRAAEEGLEVTELTRAALDKLQPNLNKEILGAVHYQCDAHTSPNEIMAQLKGYLKKWELLFVPMRKYNDLNLIILGSPRSSQVILNIPLMRLSLPVVPGPPVWLKLLGCVCFLSPAKGIG